MVTPTESNQNDDVNIEILRRGETALSEVKEEKNTLVAGQLAVFVLFLLPQ